jgi:hypothetical protein
MIALTQPSCHNQLKSLNSFSVSLLEAAAIKEPQLEGFGGVRRADVGFGRRGDQPEHASALEAEINDLLNEKEEIEKWATAGSA